MSLTMKKSHILILPCLCWEHWHGITADPWSSSHSDIHRMKINCPVQGYSYQDFHPLSDSLCT